MRAFVRDVLPRLARYDTAVLVNVCGDTVEEYAEVTRILDDAPGVDAVEINISCPNVKKGGMAFGGDPAHDLRGGGRGAQGHAPAGDPQALAQRRGHHASSRAPARRRARTRSPASTRCSAWRSTSRRRRPRLAFGTGGLSGPAIRPIAVRMAWQAARAVRIPVIGIGGIASAEDALEFLIAGCRAVQVGTANFVDPGVYERILAGLRRLPGAPRPRPTSTHVVGTLQLPGRVARRAEETGE